MTSWRCGLLFSTLLAATLFAARVSFAEKPADQPPLMPPAGQKADDAPPADPGKQVLLSYAKYKELLDEIARLKAKSKPLPPAKCRLLKGRVEGGVVFFTAQFEFHAERPDSVFALACGQAKALAAQQQPDGRTPLLSSDQDGFQVQVEKPGDYQVSLDLSLPLSQRPGGRGLELDLPRAVVTTLENMELPPDARSPRLGGKDLTETSLTLKNGHIDGPLGPADKLDLSWQGAPPPGVGPASDGPRPSQGPSRGRLGDDGGRTPAASPGRPGRPVDTVRARRRRGQAIPGRPAARPGSQPRRRGGRRPLHHRPEGTERRGPDAHGHGPRAADGRQAGAGRPLPGARRGAAVGGGVGQRRGRTAASFIMHSRSFRRANSPTKSAAPTRP